MSAVDPLLLAAGAVAFVVLVAAVVLILRNRRSRSAADGTEQDGDGHRSTTPWPRSRSAPEETATLAIHEHDDDVVRSTVDVAERPPPGPDHRPVLQAGQALALPSGGVDAVPKMHTGLAVLPVPALPAAPRRTEPRLCFVAEGSTDAGPRERNDDTWMARDHLLVVADGVGGKPAGKLAADLAARTLRDSVNVTADPANELIRAVELAHNIIRERGERDPMKTEMGCTLDAVVVHGTGVLVGVHVGDSRTYVCRAGEPVQQMTVDEAVDGKLLQSLGGITRKVVPHIWQCPVRPGDRVVLATDGLWSRLDDHVVSALISATAQLEPVVAARVVLDTAIGAGVLDNVTVIVADIADWTGAVAPLPAVVASSGIRGPIGP